MSWLPDSPLFRWVLLGGVAILVVGGIAGAGWAWYSAQEARARTAMAETVDAVQQAQAPNATPEARERAIRALEGVLSEHPRASVLALAAYQLGNLRYAAGQFPQARGAYEVALAKGASTSLRVLCQLGIAYAWEAEKSYTQAQSAFESALAGKSSKDFMYEELLLGLGRVQELSGNRAAAVQTYQRLLKDVPDTQRGDDIRSRIAGLQSLARP
jgi:tetratricopeptide (TPR) repeat protein